MEGASECVVDELLTLRERKTSRHQVISTQTERTVRETLELVEVSLGAGMRETGIYRPKVTEPDAQHEEDVAAGGHHGD